MQQFQTGEKLERTLKRTPVKKDRVGHKDSVLTETCTGTKEIRGKAVAYTKRPFQNEKL